MCGPADLWCRAHDVLPRDAEERGPHEPARLRRHLLLMAAAPATLLVLVLSLVTGLSGDATSAIGGIVGAFAVLLRYPIATAIGLSVVAGLYHLLVLLILRPSNAGFGTT
ncbi:MAG: hypothetical protein AVDCRST_MAG01-01-1618 [uncultured Rubrobacteraceae bacterium]|uniref:Uncharacterized protein n=1 Tax=uncultured Rubrobacteraceae bacterium TaxID=349277 RepID=A0A6J4PDT3_9ACTN|nr:MAG: hypothetical protein AVDCRST_MAG01-01-1618 [uncultured Rubrobacteraceae bacterium]